MKSKLRKSKCLNRILIILIISFTYSISFGQDTFSIVAADTLSMKVGSAGASCVDLTNFNLEADFLGDLLPGVGAINTQAAYDPTNQVNARIQLQSGSTPTQAIDWLVSNDVSGQPQIRQYGIVGFTENGLESASFTGINTLSYANHVLGPDYAIQGNILSGQAILDSMEARFNNQDGQLACKLMEALQGANFVGADTRCAANGTSSLFAFLKVSEMTDTYGSPSLVLGVITQNGAGIEPIDSLQILFNDIVESCGVEWFQDLDNDGFGNPNAMILSETMPPGYILDNSDCNDNDATVYPNAPELCDGLINNCLIQGLSLDEVDNDDDGFVECIIDAGGWDGPIALMGEDCNDNNAVIYPGAVDICDGLDNDCDGTFEEDCVLASCDGTDLIINSLTQDTFYAKNTIESSIIVNGVNTIQFNAEVEIDLFHGFEVPVGVLFEANISPCDLEGNN